MSPHTPSHFRPLILAAVLSLAIGGCGAESTQNTAKSPSVTTGSLRWKSCNGHDGPEGLLCSSLSVPLNYSEPKGAHINVALDMHRATSSNAIGDLVYNPGGPGVSAVDDLPFLIDDAFDSSLIEDFNIIGFDPRGVGHSSEVRCLNGTAMDAYLHTNPIPTTTVGFNVLISADRTYATACEKDTGALLGQVGTLNAARDLDQLRQALGQKTLNFFGFSYGTFLGATYAKEFPTNIRTMVLDGAEDPAADALASTLQQSTGLENDFSDFVAYCAKTPSCGWNPPGGGTEDVESDLSKVAEHPVTVDGTTQSVGPSELLYGIGSDLYAPSEWNQLGDALSALDKGDGIAILDLFDNYVDRGPDGTYDNLIAAETAIDCDDGQAPSIAQVQAAVPAEQAASPIFGVFDLYSLLQCSVWPYPGAPYGPISAAGSPPIVVVGSTGDPITPYPDAVALSKELSNGILVTRNGDGHTGYTFSTCVQNVVDNYLITAKAPAQGIVCSTDES